MSLTLDKTNTEKTVRVWDPLVRIVHWALLLFFIVSYISSEESRSVHVYSGYAIISLVMLRLLWGLIGSHYARFSQFVVSPVQAIAYLQGLPKGSSPRYIGHNPAGGWGIVLLLSCLLVVTFTGMKVHAIQSGKGPFSVIDVGVTKADFIAQPGDTPDIIKSKKAERKKVFRFWKEFHEIAVNVMIFLIVLHVLGVIASSVAHKEKLILSMITGRKRE